MLGWSAGKLDQVGSSSETSDAYFFVCWDSWATWSDVCDMDLNDLVYILCCELGVCSYLLTTVAMVPEWLHAVSPVKLLQHTLYDQQPGRASLQQQFVTHSRKPR